jgi:serine/threonine protein kinase
MSDPLVGKQLGDYVVQKLLGKGGMARIYVGYDDRLQRYAAVKVINTELLMSDRAEYTERFRREARAIARLKHSNIVGIYQFGAYESVYYMAQVYVDGKDLRQILREYGERNQKMPVRDVVSVLQGIASALDYAHLRGVIHRDIKPSNIMIDEEGIPVLTDFGLALASWEGTLGDTFGTAHYIAPEQAVSSARAVPQSDQYALAVVAFEMLAGRVPFDEESAMSVALKHLNEAPPNLRSFAPNLPAAVDAVMSKALEKEPGARYPSVVEMANAFSRALLGPSAALASAVRPPDGDSVISRPTRLEMDPPSNALPFRVESFGPKAADNAYVEKGKKEKPTNKKRRRLPLFLAAFVMSLLVGSGVYIASRQPAIITSQGTLTPLAQNSTAVITNGSAAQGTATAEIAMTNTQAAITAATAMVNTRAATTPAITPATAVPTTAIPEATTAVAPAATTPSQPSATHTATDIPTLDATLVTPASPTSATTPTLVEANSMFAIWNNEQFTLVNQTGQAADLSGVNFVLVGGENERSFAAERWSQGEFTPSNTPDGWCFQTSRIEIGNVRPLATCRLAAFRQVSAPFVFWASNNATAAFEVRRGDAVLASCPLSEGQCRFSLQNP